MRCAARRDKRADPERCATQYPGLTSYVNRRVADLSRDSVLVTLILLFGSHSECQ